MKSKLFGIEINEDKINDQVEIEFPKDSFDIKHYLSEFSDIEAKFPELDEKAKKK